MISLNTVFNNLIKKIEDMDLEVAKLALQDSFFCSKLEDKRR